MSISNLTEPNNLDLYCGSINVKNSDINLTGLYDIKFLNDPLQQAFTLQTQDPTALVFKTGDWVILNGDVELTMTIDQGFLNVVLVLPDIPGYNLYDELQVISGYSYETTQNSSLVSAVADTATEIRLEWQNTDGTGFVETGTYVVSYTLRYRLTNL
jgi:hypothetical protein